MLIILYKLRSAKWLTRAQKKKGKKWERQEIPFHGAKKIVKFTETDQNQFLSLSQLHTSSSQPHPLAHVEEQQTRQVIKQGKVLIYVVFFIKLCTVLYYLYLKFLFSLPIYKQVV